MLSPQYGFLKRGYTFWDRTAQAPSSGYNTLVAATPANVSAGASPFESGLVRKTLVGWFLSGVLSSFLGAILPVWRYHLTEDFLIVGNFFLAMNVGILVAVPLWRYVLPKRNLSLVLGCGCGIACVSLLFLAELSPATLFWWRMAGIAGIGCGNGLLNLALFQALTPVYRMNPSASLSLSGTFFGLGCAVTALLVAGTFFMYTVPSILVFLAALPGYGAGIFAIGRLKMPEEPDVSSFRRRLVEFRTPAAVLLALLLFFQFGNEWAIAGWLPLFLTRRVGASPEGALMLLAVYWLALVVGRVVVLSILPAVNHARLLGASVLAALFGCTILFSTNNRFGATIGVLLVGAGFASVYPLVAERIGKRFPDYQPSFYSGIFCLGMTGGMLAPWSLGLFANLWGIRVAMILPVFGSVMVFLLVLAIWAETKFSFSTQSRI